MTATKTADQTFTAFEGDFMSGMNGTGINKGDKVRADYVCTNSGKTYKRSVVTIVENAWPMGPGKTVLWPAGIVVETDSVAVIA